MQQKDKKMPLETALNRIKYYAFVEKGWTKNQLAREAKVPFSVVAKIHTPDWNPTLEKLFKLEALVPADFSLAGLVTEFSQPQRKGKTDDKR